jgi:carbonic anhydrase/acetyltransferase-like protein (isoleucine patch superfamily)
MNNTFDFKDGKGPVPARQHPNGGGWVADTAMVYPTACVDKNAQVSGDALVYGYAQISGNAQVSGDAWVYGYAQISGNAQVSGDAWVYGNAQLSGNAWVYGNAQVSEHAQVSEKARVAGDAQISGNAWVYGNAQVYGYARVYGYAQVKRGYYTTTPISITRSDNYTFTLQSDGSVVAGCRTFTSKEADDHWGNPKHRTHLESMAILSAIRAIDAARKGQADG